MSNSNMNANENMNRVMGRNANEQGFPNMLNLADDLRWGAKGIRREVIHNTTTQNEYRPGNIAVIPIDTGTHGAFMDTRATRLQFTVELQNSNPYIDMINLPRCGFQCLIREMSLEINGVPVETNRQYAECVESEMIRNGENEDAYPMLFENPWRPAGGAAGTAEINFIKPCMVTLNGRPLLFGITQMDSNMSLQVAGGFLGAVNYAHDEANVVTQASVMGMVGGHTVFRPPPLMDIISLQVSNAVTYDGAGVQINDPNLNNKLNGSGFNHTPYDNEISRDLCAVQFTGPHNNDPGSPNETHTPAQWPFYQPCAESVAERIQQLKNKKISMANVIQYYANVKCLPCPVKTGNAIASYTHNLADSLSITEPSKYQYYVSTEIYSGLIGKMARKMFPELMVQAGKMHLRIRWQDAHRAFQTLADPCRRVPGTLRDFVPFTGRRHNRARNAQGVADLCAGVHPIQAYTPVATTVYNNASVMGTYTVPSLMLSAIWAEPNLPIRPAIANPPAAGDPLLYGDVTQELPVRYLRINTGTGPSAVVAANTVTQYVQNSANENHNPFGLPIPQYIPMTTPWLRKDAASVNSFTAERNIFFGTYLSASKPQVRRTHTALQPLGVSSDVNIGLSLTYIVRDVQLKTDQILLPDIIAHKILETAINEGVHIGTHLFKESSAQLPAAASVKQLINLASTNVTDIAFFFRHTDQLNGDQAFGYNSFSFYNPFQALSMAVDATKDVGGIYTYQSPFTSASHLGTNIQLQVGAEQYPRSPINNIVDLINETLRGDGMRKHDQKIDYLFGIKSDFTLATAIDGFLDGFFATFTPIDCLDDQSITANPYFIYAEQSEDPLIRIRGRRQWPVHETRNNDSVTFGGVLPLLQPLEGTFHISFNLETFRGSSNHLMTGVSLVTNSMFLKMEKAYLCSTGQIEMLSIARVAGNIMFETSGNVAVNT